MSDPVAPKRVRIRTEDGSYDEELDVNPSGIGTMPHTILGIMFNEGVSTVIVEAIELKPIRKCR